MNYDHASDLATEVREHARQFRDADALPPGPWSELAAAGPAAVHEVLEFLGKRKLDGAFRRAWREQQPPYDVPVLVRQAISDPSVDLIALPPFTWLLQFQFTLRQPLLTKDDATFYPTENPMRKDRALRIPHYAASGWKGSVSGALHWLGRDRGDAQVVRLLGNDRAIESQADSRAGRLTFFPTFFNGLGFAMIHPQNRKTKTGIPIDLELVPKGETGWFRLLHVPLTAGWPETEVPDDLVLVCKALHRIFAETGIGAKVSSGFGSVKARVADGSLIWRTGTAVQRREFQETGDLLGLRVGG